MTGKELLDYLQGLTRKQLEREVVVHQQFDQLVYTGIKPHQVSLEDAGADCDGDEYPDCIMVSIG